MSEQMDALRDMLSERGVDWWDNSDDWFERTSIRPDGYDGVVYSVVFGDGSFGCEEGLLESMPPVHPDYDDDVEGYLTADAIVSALLF